MLASTANPSVNPKINKSSSTAYLSSLTITAGVSLLHITAYWTINLTTNILTIVSYNYLSIFIYLNSLCYIIADN